ncbi:hypothetical protein Tco_1499086 [Tanacetum coccineum]
MALFGRDVKVARCSLPPSDCGGCLGRFPIAVKTQSGWLIGASGGLLKDLSRGLRSASSLRCSLGKVSAALSYLDIGVFLVWVLTEGAHLFDTKVGRSMISQEFSAAATLIGIDLGKYMEWNSVRLTAYTRACLRWLDLVDLNPCRDSPYVMGFPVAVPFGPWKPVLVSLWPIRHRPRYGYSSVAKGDLRKFSDIGAWYAIEDCAQYDKKYSNPTSAISNEIIANPNAQIVGDDMVRVHVPREVPNFDGPEPQPLLKSPSLDEMFDDDWGLESKEVSPALKTCYADEPQTIVAKESMADTLLNEKISPCGSGKVDYSILGFMGLLRKAGRAPVRASPLPDQDRWEGAP